MLRSKVEKKLNIPLTLCRECLLDAGRFLSQSPYTYTVKKRGDAYEVVFKWRKLGMTRYFKVVLRPKETSEGIEYEPLQDSDYRFNMKFRLDEDEEGTTLTVTAEMDAGIAATLLGRGDFRRFVEDLVDNGLQRLINEMAGAVAGKEEARAPSEKPGAPQCTTCMLYESGMGYCFYLGKKVEDPSNPPCGGERYVDKSLLG